VSSLEKLGVVALVVIVFLLLASYFLAMLLGPALFFLTPVSLDFSLGVFFLLAWSLFVLCFLAGWQLRESFHHVVSKAFSRPFNRLFNNWLFAMPVVASTLLYAVSLIITVQDLGGVPTGGLPAPKTDVETFSLYLSLTYAPLIEEIGFRIFPIGIFLAAHLLVTQTELGTTPQSFFQRLKLFLVSFLYPDKAKRMVEGVKNVAANGVLGGISKGEWLMLLFTSLVFGAAHIVSGIGWEFGKITSTFVQGFVFGLVYLAYGVQASILLHWFFNYYFYSFQLAAHYLSSGFDFFMWIELLTLRLGLVFLVVFAYFGVKRMLTRKSVSSEPTTTAAVTPESP
jgi:membrane protease YdiL (CAAX protease family)